MIGFRKLAIAMAIAGATHVVPAVAVAQDGADTCACTTPATGEGQPVGSITSATGDVQVSQSTGFVSSGAGTPLSYGDSVMVGAQSSSKIRVGSCRLTLGANTTTEIKRQDGAICLVVADAAGGIGAAGLGAGAALTAGFAVGTFTITILTDDDDDDDRPASQ